MKKLALNAAELKVLSFETAAAARDAGTVYGAQDYSQHVTCAKPCWPTIDLAATSPCVCIGDAR